jgi:hypothetical protein
MLERLLIFGIGYVLGTRAGKERFDELVSQARHLLERDEVKMAINLAGGLIEERIGSGTERLRAA